MQNETDPVLYWIGLSSIPGVGRVTFRRLVSHFGTPEKVLAASLQELRDVDGVSGKTADAITSCSWQEHAEQEIAKARDAGVAIITTEDPSYPARLRDTPDPPLYLYVKGMLPSSGDMTIAIVGTRTPSHYGRTVTHRLAYELASDGCAIISGMARGIDTQAHRGALAAGGKTVAVLACGIDLTYPPESKALKEDIIRTGAVVTENPFGTKPEAGYFPARNRVIAGLSRGTVIIEATEDSGSLITADYTLEQGKKLFAVPGNIGSPTSKGTNSLIKQGATLVEGSADIRRGLSIIHTSAAIEVKSHPLPQMAKDEETVFRCITEEPKHIDSIMAESRLDAGRLSGILITLELKGLAKQLPGKYFIRQDF